MPQRISQIGRHQRHVTQSGKNTAESGVERPPEQAPNRLDALDRRLPLICRVGVFVVQCAIGLRAAPNSH